jgi:hypothetical protein
VWWRAAAVEPPPFTLRERERGGERETEKNVPPVTEKVHLVEFWLENQLQHYQQQEIAVNTIRNCIPYSGLGQSNCASLKRLGCGCVVEPLVKDFIYLHPRTASASAAAAALSFPPTPALYPFIQVPYSVNKYRMYPRVGAHLAIFVTNFCTQSLIGDPI